MADAPYIGSALPSKVVMTDGITDLFTYAQRELGDPLQWWRIAQLNGVVDPNVVAGLQLQIPKSSSQNNDGLPYA